MRGTHRRVLKHELIVDAFLNEDTNLEETTYPCQVLEFVMNPFEYSLDLTNEGNSIILQALKSLRFTRIPLSCVSLTRC